MTYHNTDLADLFITANPSQSVGSPQRAADGPSPVSATHAAAATAAPSIDKMIMAEVIPGTMLEPELAAFLGIGTSRVRTLAKDGVLIRNKGGKKGSPAGFDVRASLAAYLSRLRDGAVKAGPVTDEMKAAKLRQTEAAAQKIEIQNAAARGELLPASAVASEWAGILRTVRAGLLAVPSRVSARLGHLSGHDLSEIDLEIRAVLAELAGGEDAAS